MPLFKNKYSSESNRLKNWDYSSEAIYFITVVTKNKECIFGSIVNEKMILNDNGKIIENELLKSIEIRDNWIFHNWIIMPNHIHLLVEITMVVETHIVETHIVETHSSASLRQQQPKPQLSRKPKSISSFVAIFKSVTTKQINQMNRETLLCVSTIDSIWQSNYHDHIVRNADSFDTIFYYIKNNPIKWGKDKFNIDNPT